MIFNIQFLAFFLTLFIIINAQNEDGTETSSEDVFSQLVMTSTKTLPTATNNPVLTTSTKVLPTNIESDGKISTEIVYGKYYANFDKKLTTRLPEDVEDAFVTCITYYRPAFCDYGMNCYKSYDSFSYSGSNTYCTIYTSKANDVIPNYYYYEYTSICHPKPSTSTETLDVTTYTKSSLTTYISEEITEIVYETVYDLKYHDKPGYECKEVQKAFTTKTNTLPTGSVNRSFFYTIDGYKRLTPVAMVLPSTMDTVDIDVKCRTVPGHGKSTNTLPVKYISSSIPMTTNTKSTTTSRTVPKTYCDRGQNCYAFYKSTSFSQIPVLPTTYCNLYTSIPVPTYSVPIEEVCHPTIYPTSSTVQNDHNIWYTMSSTLPLSTTIYNGTKKTILSTNYRRTTTQTYYTYSCQGVSTKTPTDIIPSTSEITTPTISTKCIPTVITVTEKEKVTVTNKNTVTVTVEVEEE